MGLGTNPATSVTGDDLVPVELSSPQRTLTCGVLYEELAESLPQGASKGRVAESRLQRGAET